MADYRFPGEHERDGMILEAPVTDETLDDLETFDMVEGDILIATYPKAGTTWMEELTWLVCNNGDVEKARITPLHDRMHYLEFKLNGVTSGLQKVNKGARPTIMKTHLRSETFLKQIAAGKVKIIVVIRNPKDVLVSLYNFYMMNKGLGNFQGSWDDFFELYQTKHLLYGDYFDWYASWLKHMDKPNVILVKFEDMKSAMPDVLGKMSNFLGKAIPVNATDDVIQHLTFESMKKNDMTNYSQVPFFNMDVSPFMRKGKVGDWRNYFNKQQSALVDATYKERIESLGVHLNFV